MISREQKGVHGPNPPQSLNDFGSAIDQYLQRTTDTRRGFLRRLGRGAAIGATAMPVVDMLLKTEWQLAVDRPSPEIKWVAGQEERLQTADSMVLCFAGTGIGTGMHNANILLPELQKMGVVGYVEYSTRGIKPDEIVDKMLEVKKNHPNIKKFSVYGHSTGPLVLGRVLQVMHERGEEFPLEYVVADCLPAGISYLKNAEFVKGVATANDALGGSSLITGIDNAIVFGNPVDWESAAPLLLKDQIDIMWEGEKHLAWIGKAVDRYGSKIINLRPKDPAKDTFVDHTRSEPVLRRILEREGRWITVELEGNEGHANPDKNTKAYLEGISKAQLVLAA